MNRITISITNTTIPVIAIPWGIIEEVNGEKY
jgi:hypothetical protein